MDGTYRPSFASAHSLLPSEGLLQKIVLDFSVQTLELVFIGLFSALYIAGKTINDQNSCLFLPGRDLIGVDFVLAGQIRKRHLAGECIKRDPSLEIC